MDERIKDALQEGPLVALYLVTGVNQLKEKIDSMSDEEIGNMFEHLLHPSRVRDNINTLYQRLNCPTG